MIWICLLACSDKAAQIDTELGYQVIDSGKLHDSAAPTDSASPTEPELKVYPQHRAIRTGSHFALRTVLQMEGHSLEELNATWSSDQPSVIEIDGQTAHAHAVGTATLTAETDAGSRALEFTVIESETITVQVLDTDTMSPVEGITVTANSSVIGSTNTLGELEVNAAGLDSISIYQQGYIPVSVLSITADRITLPAVPTSETMIPMAESSGTIDFSAMAEPDFNEVSVALTVPQHRNILSVTMNDLFRSTRLVSIFGTEANIPDSISLNGYDDTFKVFSHLETPTKATFSINVPALSLTEAANETDPFELLAPLIPNMVFDLSTGQPQPYDGLMALVAPELAPAPIEYADPNVILFHGIQNSSTGFEVCGLGIAESLNPTVYTSSGSQCNEANQFVAAIFESENDQHRSSMVRSKGPSFPNFIEAPSLTLFEPSSKAVSMSLSTETQLVQIWIRAADGSQRILYVPPHLDSFELPTPPFPMGYGNTTWSIQQLQLNHGTYHDWLSQPVTSLHQAEKNAQSSGLIRFQLIQ